MHFRRRPLLTRMGMRVRDGFAMRGVISILTPL
jgi:hypothetical protein